MNTFQRAVYVGLTLGVTASTWLTHGAADGIGIFAAMVTGAIALAVVRDAP